jgi:hypothetical protein
MRKIKDKEGVVFEIGLDRKVDPKSRQKESVLFIKSIIENRLKSYNVYPENNKVGFHGEVEHISYFLGHVCESYVEYLIMTNQIDVLK